MYCSLNIITCAIKIPISHGRLYCQGHPLLCLTGKHDPQRSTRVKGVWCVVEGVWCVMEGVLCVVEGVLYVATIAVTCGSWSTVSTDG